MVQVKFLAAVRVREFTVGQWIGVSVDVIAAVFHGDLRDTMSALKDVIGGFEIAPEVEM